MINKEWILCPLCQKKTRNMIRSDTILKKFPLYCPKCKQESLISIKKFEITTITGEPVKTT